MKALGTPVQWRVIKVLDKIRKTPELGKPLRAQLAGFFAERVGKIRVIYRYDERAVYLVRCRERKEGY